MTCEHDAIEWDESMKETTFAMFSKKGECEDCGQILQEIWEYHGKYDLEGKEI